MLRMAGFVGKFAMFTLNDNNEGENSLAVGIHHNDVIMICLCIIILIFSSLFC
jgi:hypothetical protein